VFPPEQSANFVVKMEDVLSVYKRPYDPKRPVACTGEIPRQLIREVREPLPMESGKPERHDYHYPQWSGEPVYVLRAAGRMVHSDGSKATDQN